MVPKILEVISSYSSAQIVDEKKEAVVGEAAITLRWILIRCGAIALDEQTNSFVLGATYRAKVHDMVGRKFANHTDFCKCFLQHLKSMEADPDKLPVEVAFKILSFICLLLEVAPDENPWNTDEIFSTNEFIYLMLNLLERALYQTRISAKNSINIVRGILVNISVDALWKEGIDFVLLKIISEDPVANIKVP